MATSVPPTQAHVVMVYWQDQRDQPARLYQRDQPARAHSQLVPAGTYRDSLRPGPGLAMRAGTTRPGARAYTTITGKLCHGPTGSPAAGSFTGTSSEVSHVAVPARCGRGPSAIAARPPAAAAGGRALQGSQVTSHAGDSRSRSHESCRHWHRGRGPRAGGGGQSPATPCRRGASQ